jgi:hypothetical protein
MTGTITIILLIAILRDAEHEVERNEKRQLGLRGVLVTVRTVGTNCGLWVEVTLAVLPLPPLTFLYALATVSFPHLELRQTVPTRYGGVGKVGPPEPRAHWTALEQPVFSGFVHWSVRMAT